MLIKSLKSGNVSFWFRLILFPKKGLIVLQPNTRGQTWGFLSSLIEKSIFVSHLCCFHAMFEEGDNGLPPGPAETNLLAELIGPFSGRVQLLHVNVASSRGRGRCRSHSFFSSRLA